MEKVATSKGRKYLAIKDKKDRTHRIAETEKRGNRKNRKEGLTGRSRKRGYQGLN